MQLQKILGLKAWIRIECCRHVTEYLHDMIRHIFPAEGAAVSILSKDLVATQKNVGWNGQPARALDGNLNGQWNAGCV